MARRIRIGTRGSRLALWQSEWVKGALEGLAPDLEVALVTIKTAGDKIQDRDLPRGADKGFFIKELEDALLAEEVDLAVHSLKDLPTRLPEGLALAAVPRRADPRDALIGRSARTLAELRRGAAVATGSLRRKAQLLHLRPDIEVVPVRGNVPTRIEKLDREGWDGLVLARAGLERLSLDGRVTETFDPLRFLPAVGQGALGLEVRAEDALVLALAGRLEDEETRLAATAERALLRALEGGCQVPVGAYARRVGEELALAACVASVDGRRLVRDQVLGAARGAEDAEALGRALAERLLADGGREILQALRGGGA